jgi:hypothetical protein
MHPDDWLETARADAQRRGLADVQAALEGLARTARLLRAAEWNDDASGAADARPDAPDAG